MRFYQIFPQQRPPILAKDVSVNIPKRAELFCQPYTTALNLGVLCYPPIDFDVYIDDACMKIRTYNIDEANEKIVTIPKQAEKNQITYLRLQDLSPSMSQTCLQYYRERLAQTNMPDWLNRKTFGFYEIMVNGLYEVDVDVFYLQVWLGGVITTPPGQHIWVKHPAHHLTKPPFTCLDALIESDRWHGWFTVVLRPDIQQQWIEFRTDSPICQLLPFSTLDSRLQIIETDDVPNHILETPLHWHIFDPSYGKKPGKYKRESC